MTLFEFLSVVFSLVLALGVSRGLNGVRSAYMLNRRYWPHALWLFNKLLNAVTYWWWLWSYSEAKDYWNLFNFFLALMIPVILYLQMDSLVTHRPREVTNWKAHYYSEHRWFFGFNAVQAALACYILSNFGNPMPAHVLGVLWALITLILSVVCYKSKQHKTHMVAAVVVASGQVLFLISNMQVPNAA